MVIWFWCQTRKNILNKKRLYHNWLIHKHTEQEGYLQWTIFCKNHAIPAIWNKGTQGRDNENDSETAFSFFRFHLVANRERESLWDETHYQENNNSYQQYNNLIFFSTTIIDSKIWERRSTTIESGIDTELVANNQATW